RLRKYITTEQVAATVPVQREEARIEREPITDANVGAAMRGGDLTEEEHELTLSEEEVTVDKKVVPKERVRLDKDVVTEERSVTEQVRKENIDVEGDAKPRRRRS
ncbi:MAG TPA: YsnF/AvaK domain-containing protein, partial [Acidimicrobiales bacterium]|nr:YsnF/AvaK domain-containing protein [Acidimicrobiales bacterium]